MCTGRTLKRCFQGLDDTSALPASPLDFLGLLEDALVLHGFSQFVVTPLVPFLHGAYLLENLCHILKSFLGGFVGKACIKSGPFVSLAGSSGFQLS
jgi:hypothetical protein